MQSTLVPAVLLPSPFMPYALLNEINPYGTLSNIWAASTWPSANRAIYQPWLFPTDCSLDEITALGTNTTGNYDLAIYDKDFNRLASKGSTAMAAATLSLSLSGLRIKGGDLYYLAMVCDSASSGYFRCSTGSAARTLIMGVGNQTSAFPLPNPMVPAAPAGDQFPLMAAIVR